MSEANNNPNPNDPGDPGTGAGTDGGNPGDATLLGGDGSNPIDYAALFTWDEVKAKQEAIASAKAEEARRAALTDEEREKEDIERAKGEAWNAPPPEEYEAFVMPDGHEADVAIVDEFKPVFKKLGLSQEKAQALINLYHEKIMPKNLERATAQWDAIRDGWGEQAKTDKEFGGEKFEENFSFAKKAMDHFATPELRSAMNEYGFGNHPEVIRLMVRIGKQMSEDQTLPGQSAAGKEKSPYIKYKT